MNKIIEERGKMKLNIEGIRGQIGDTKENFAKKLGMSLNTYNKKLSGKVEWKPSQLNKVCELGNIDMAELDYTPIDK